MVIVPKVPTGDQIIIPKSLDYNFALPISEKDKSQLKEWIINLNLDEILNVQKNEESDMKVEIKTYRVNEDLFQTENKRLIRYYESEDEISECLDAGNIFDIEISFGSGGSEGWVSFILRFKVNNKAHIFFDDSNTDHPVLIELVKVVRKEIKEFAELFEDTITTWQEAKKIFQRTLQVISNL